MLSEKNFYWAKILAQFSVSPTIESDLLWYNNSVQHLNQRASKGIAFDRQDDQDRLLDDRPVQPGIGPDTRPKLGLKPQLKVSYPPAPTSNPWFGGLVQLAGYFVVVNDRQWDDKSNVLDHHEDLAFVVQFKPGQKSMLERVNLELFDASGIVTDGAFWLMSNYDLITLFGILGRKPEGQKIVTGLKARSVQRWKKAFDVKQKSSQDTWIYSQALEDIESLNPNLLWPYN